MERLEFELVSRRVWAAYDPSSLTLVSHDQGSSQVLRVCRSSQRRLQFAISMGELDQELTMEKLLFALEQKVKLELDDGVDKADVHNISGQETFPESQVTGFADNATRIAVAMRVIYNSHRPACRLPVETLELIFSFRQPTPDWETLSFPFYMPVSPSRIKGNKMRWINFSWVCHYWRQAALGMSVIWDIINFEIRYSRYRDTTGSGDAAVAFLERSRTLPIHISQWIRLTEPEDIGYKFNTYDFHQEVVPFYEALKQQTHRVRTCDIHSDYVFQDNLWDVLKKPFPNIKSLQLSITEDNREYEDKHVSRLGPEAEAFRYRLPMLFGEKTVSQLRKMSLWRFSSWINLFPSVTHLSLNEQYHDFRPPIHNFLDALEAMPFLEVLRLDCAGPIIDREFSPPDRRIALHHMKHLEIHWRTLPALPPQFPVLIMPCFDLPKTVDLTFVSPEIFCNEDNIEIHLPPGFFTDDITLLRVIISQRLTSFVIRSGVISIETSYDEEQWFNNDFSIHYPQIETLIITRSDHSVTLDYPDFLQLRHIHMNWRDSLMRLLRVLSDSANPRCRYLQDITVHGEYLWPYDEDYITEEEASTRDSLVERKVDHLKIERSGFGSDIMVYWVEDPSAMKWDGHFITTLIRLEGPFIYRSDLPDSM